MIQENIEIMLVEDNINDAKLIRRQIEKIVSKPSIRHIADFDEFVFSLERFKPDIVLCDYQLNGFTGFDVLAHIGNQPRFTPVIFITGTINNEELAAGTILTGASGYILKNNINALHKKLLPLFMDIIDAKRIIPLTEESRTVFLEMQHYLKTVTLDNEAMKASYTEMRRAMNKIKDMNK